MAILNSIINWINYKRIYEIELLSPSLAGRFRRKCFLIFSNKARYTEWGKKYDYEKHQTFRSISGEGSNFTLRRGRILHTSHGFRRKKYSLAGRNEVVCKIIRGTTNAKSKFIPVSKDSLSQCHFRGGKDVLAIYYRNFPNASILSGKALTLGGSHQVNTLTNNSYYGDLSAIMIENLPFWTDFHRTPPTDIALIQEFEEKIKQITQKSVKDNVTSLAGVPSWFLVLLQFVLEYTGKSNTCGSLAQYGIIYSRGDLL